MPTSTATGSSNSSTVLRLEGISPTRLASAATDAPLGSEANSRSAASAAAEAASAPWTSVTKEIFANHYNEGAIGYTGIVPEPMGTGTFLVHTLKVRIDVLRGWGLFHGRVRRGVRGRLEQRLESLRERVERAR